MASPPSKQKPNVLKPRVEAAIDKIVSEGGKPTQVKIVEITGGSLRDYSPVIREVMAERAAREAAARSIPKMPEEVADMASEIWGAAYRAADEVAAAERKSHVEQAAQFETERTELEDLVGEREDERDEAITQVKEQSAQLADLLEKCREYELEIARLTGRLAEREDAVRRSLERQAKEKAAADAAACDVDLKVSSEAVSQSEFPLDFSRPVGAPGSSPAV
ncbi:DNA-binding protein [Limimaricola variabilis]